MFKTKWMNFLHRRRSRCSRWNKSKCSLHYTYRMHTVWIKANRWINCPVYLQGELNPYTQRCYLMSWSLLRNKRGNYPNSRIDQKPMKNLRFIRLASSERTTVSVFLLWIVLTHQFFIILLIKLSDLNPCAFSGHVIKCVSDLHMALVLELILFTNKKRPSKQFFLI